jgi:hypothetical protein
MPPTKLNPNQVPSVAGAASGIYPAGTTLQYLRGDNHWATLPTTLPASDVYAWAKASTKPTYTYTEVGADPSGAAAAITLVGLGGVPSNRKITSLIDLSADRNLTYSDVGAAPLYHTQAVSTISDATTVGQNLVKLTNPSAITFPRINADNSVSTLAASTFLTAIGGAAVAQTMYIGTTSLAINRGSGTLNLAGIGTLDVGAITSTGTVLKLGTQTKNIETVGILLGTELTRIEFTGNASYDGGALISCSPTVMSTSLTFSLRYSSTTWTSYLAITTSSGVAFPQGCTIPTSKLISFSTGVNTIGGTTAGIYVSKGLHVGGTADAGDNNLLVDGTITSGDPTGGTAGAWKLGIRVAATVILDTTQYIQLDIGGTLYKLAIAT